jgi:DNA-binding transcriptional regulator YiaG
MVALARMSPRFARTQAMTGTDLRRRRLRLGWSRNQLAHQLGVSAEDLAAWEEESSSIGCPAAAELLLRDGERTDEPRRPLADEGERRRYVG